MQWFKHDTNSTMDFKIKKLIIKYGAIGYAIYFHCLELIAGEISENNITFELEHDSEIIADDLRIKGSEQRSGKELVEEVMRYMISLNLFEESEGHIFCFKLLKRLDTSMTSNGKLRELISKAKKQELFLDLQEAKKDNHDKVMTNLDFIMQEENRLEEEKTTQEKNITYSAEQAEQKAKVEPLPLNDGTEWQPTVTEFNEYVRLYPNVDVISEFRKMRGWCIGNPKKRKTKHGISRFVNAWLGKEQDKPSYNKGYQQPYSSNKNSSPNSYNPVNCIPLSKLEGAE